MTTIKINDLVFGFDSQEKLLFNELNTNIQTDWKLGLIGRNGRGKTTLLKLLLGELDYRGSIEKTIDCVYFPQTVNNKKQRTYDVIQEIANVEDWKLKRECYSLGLKEEVLWQKFDTLSGGEQTKVLLAILFVEEGKFALIDEPTNHLDQETRIQLAQYLKSKKQGFILVSHDRSFVDEIVDHTLVIEKQKLDLYKGNFTTYEEQKEKQDEYELDKNVKLKKEIGRLRQSAAEKAEWSRSKEREKTHSAKGYIDTEDRRRNKGAIGADSARAMKRSKTIVKRMEDQATEKESLLKNIESIDPLVLSFQPSRHQRLLKLEEVQLRYENPLFQPVSFEVIKGDRWIIKGKNGSGKSSLISLLLNEFLGEYTGKIIQPKYLKMSYVRQNYEENRGTLKEFAQKNELDYKVFLSNLFKLGVERNVFQSNIEDMSMGQRKRVELAKSLTTSAELFIWDEPLNYLDVFNQVQIEQIIQQIKPTMIIVEHDETFCKNIGTKELYLK